MAAIWLTLAQAKAQLRLNTPDGDPADEFLTLEMEMAEAAIINYLQKTERGRTNVYAWTADPSTLPPTVRGAMLYRLGEFDAFRGDTTTDSGAQRAADHDLPDSVLGLLRSYTDPVLL
jgi:hypothetical protein